MSRIHPTWLSLPVELNMTVLDHLSHHDLTQLAIVNKESYLLSVPHIFKHVKLSSYQALTSFLAHVPRSYCHHVRRLDLCTDIRHEETALNIPHSRTDALIHLLGSCTRLEALSLKLRDGLATHAIPFFSLLKHLKELSIGASGSDSVMSERMVVSIAGFLPKLEKLSLNSISRSIMHAPELIGMPPYVPLVSGDNDIPPHPLLGEELSLPSLLRIPTLRELRIRDTHLGDPLWTRTPAACHLEVLELGGCMHESDDVNSIFIERIMSTIGPTVNEASLGTAIASNTAFSEPTQTPLKGLRKLRISPSFPLDSVVDTMTNLSGSPIESVSVRCFEDDVVDVCSAVENFLTLRVEKGFYKNLTSIDVSITPGDLLMSSTSDAKERADAAKRLREFCSDLRIGILVSQSDDSAATSQSEMGRSPDLTAPDKILGERHCCAKVNI